MAKPERSWWSNPPVIARYWVAVVLVPVALFTSLWLQIYLETAPTSLFICAVMFSAWFGGLGPGLLTAALSVLAFDYYFTAPAYSLSVDIKDIPRFLIFVLSAFFVGLLSAAQKSVTESLRRARDELDETVQELKRINEALRESEERFRLMAETIPETIWIIGFEPERILYLSPSYESTSGLSTDVLYSDSRLWLKIIHPEDRARAVSTFTEWIEDAGGRSFDVEYRIVQPNGAILWIHDRGVMIRDEQGKPRRAHGIMEDITERKRAEEMQAAMAREREIFAKQRAAELAKANEALRGCLDALASVPELDDFLGQVMAAITNQLGAVSSTLRLCNFEKNTVNLQFVFQDGRVMSPAEAGYPEVFQSWPLDDRRFSCFDQPATVQTLAAIPEDKRAYLLALGVRSVVVIPLISRGQAIGRLTFRFTQERDFGPEELEIARALATQASLAIQLTRLANTARQSAVLEERTRLAAEIHDSLAQFFTGISMQLGAAKEVFKAGGGNILSYLERASDIAQFGLSEARRSAFSLQPTIIEDSGLIEALQKLVERSNISGRLRCNFHSSGVSEESLPTKVQHELLRIAREAISNAVRHAKPTVVTVTLRWDPPNLILQVKDNGSGIPKARLEKSDGVGLDSMRDRAAQMDAKLEIETAAGLGTSIIVTVPISP